MKIIASREMSAKPGAIWKTLKDEGAVVVTKNGQPAGVFLATSPETWLEDIQDLIFSRARRATREIRRTAAREGVAAMTADAIAGEIRATRQDRKE